MNATSFRKFGWPAFSKCFPSCLCFSLIHKSCAIALPSRVPPHRTRPRNHDTPIQFKGTVIRPFKFKHLNWCWPSPRRLAKKLPLSPFATHLKEESLHPPPPATSCFAPPIHPTRLLAQDDTPDRLVPAIESHRPARAQSDRS